MRTRRLCALGVVAWLGVSGCATTLSTLQTGRTLEPYGPKQGDRLCLLRDDRCMQVRVEVGAGAYLPVGQVVSLIAEGVSLSKRGSEAILAKRPGFAWTPEDEQSLLTTGIAIATMPPSAQFEGAVRVGVVKNFDAGLRWSTNALRLDAKYRFLHAGDEALTVARPSAGPAGRSSDFALGVGVSKYLFSSKVIDWLEFVKMGDFSRWDVDATLYASHDFNTYVGLYAAPKYVWSSTSFDEILVRVSEVASEVVKTDVSLPNKVVTHFVGASAGLRVGVQWLSLFLELTAGHTICTARVLGVDRQLGGLTLYPAAGIASTF